MYQVRLNDSSNNLCMTRIRHKPKLFSCCFNYRSYAKIQQEPVDFDSLIWQPRLALLSRFSCPENKRTNLRSRRLVVVFPAKGNLLALTIFKQRIVISGLFYNSTVRFFSSDRQPNEQSELNHKKSWYLRQTFDLLPSNRVCRYM